MVVQIPVFISFYRVLLESVEMRQAPFLLWINDLSSRDPYFVLPLLMGSAMFAQFKLNPAPPDPMQAKIMQFHAADHDRHDGLVPLRTGAVLADEHPCCPSHSSGG